MKRKIVMIVGLCALAIGMGGCGQNNNNAISIPTETADVAGDVVEASEETEDQTQRVISLRDYLGERCEKLPEENLWNKDDFCIVTDTQGNTVFTALGKNYQAVQWIFTDIRGNAFALLIHSENPKPEEIQLSMTGSKVDLITCPDGEVYACEYEDGVLSAMNSADSSMAVFPGTDSTQLLVTIPVNEDEKERSITYYVNKQGRVTGSVYSQEYPFADNYTYYENGQMEGLEHTSNTQKVFCHYDREGRLVEQNLTGKDSEEKSLYIYDEEKNTREVTSYRKNLTDGSEYTQVSHSNQNGLQSEIATSEWTEDFDGDRTEETAILTVKYQYSGADYTSMVLLNVGEDGLGLTNLICPDKALRVLTIGGRKYLMIRDWGPSDDYVTLLYTYENGRLVEKGKLDAFFDQSDVEDGLLSVSRRKDILETSYIVVQYQVDAAGTFTEKPANEYVLEGSTVAVLQDIVLYDMPGGNAYTILPETVTFTKVTADFEWVYVENEIKSGWLHVDSRGRLVELDNKMSRDVFDGLCFAD